MPARRVIPVPDPAIGRWYRRSNGQLFEVVALDEADQTIELQFFDGTIDEVDVDTWGRLLIERGRMERSPIHGQVAAVSVGIFDGMPVLDLDYDEDSQAETDMNVVMNDAGHFIEVQGTAEGHAFTDDEFAAMIGLARAGIKDIIVAQDEAIKTATQ